MNSDGSDQRALSAHLEYAHPYIGSSAASLSYSSITDILLFAGISDGLKYVDLSDPNTLEHFSFGKEFATTAKWSPDGKRIVFTTNDDSGNMEAFVMNADGTNIVQLTHGNPSGGTNLVAVDWSPDGRQIAVNYDYKLYLVHPDGTGFHLVYPGYVRMLAWSPDGSRIAFEGGHVPNEVTYSAVDIWVINSDGTNPVNLTKTADRAELNPTWSADGKHVLFDTQYSNPMSIYSVELSSETITQLTFYGNNLLPTLIK